MNYYKCILAYDGTDYHGWQMQPDEPTVAQVLHKTFTKVFGLDASIVGASRTDSGVHALGQVVLLKTELDLEATKLFFAWNNRLPADILIRSIERVSEDFHPQRHVEQKTYWYHFFPERPLPFFARYGYYVRTMPNLDKLNESLQIFVGTHDFRSFCTGDDMGPNTVRTIDEINVTYIKRFKAYRIEVKGPGFLRYMIRRIVGASLISGQKDYFPLEYLCEVLLAKNPLHTLPTAPAHGLVLYKINYKQKEGIL